MTWRDDLDEAAAYEARRATAIRDWSRRLLAGEPVPMPWEDDLDGEVEPLHLDLRVCGSTAGVIEDFAEAVQLAAPALEHAQESLRSFSTSIKLPRGTMDSLVQHLAHQPDGRPRQALTMTDLHGETIVWEGVEFGDRRETADGVEVTIRGVPQEPSPPTPDPSWSTAYLREDCTTTSVDWVDLLGPVFLPVRQGFDVEVEVFFAGELSGRGPIDVGVFLHEGDRLVTYVPGHIASSTRVDSGRRRIQVGPGLRMFWLRWRSTAGHVARCCPLTNPSHTAKLQLSEVQPEAR